MTISTERIEELRAMAPDDPIWQSMVDRDAEKAANAPKVLPPCPPWCRHKELFADGADPDHGYDSLEFDGATYTRSHVSSRGICVAQDEFNREGVVDLGPLYLAGVGNRLEADAEDARQLAAELLNAANKLDEIARATA